MAQLNPSTDSHLREFFFFFFDYGKYVIQNAWILPKRVRWGGVFVVVCLSLDDTNELLMAWMRVFCLEKMLERMLIRGFDVNLVENLHIYNTQTKQQKSDY